MSSGERLIGAAKGKQSDTEALCQTPPQAECLHAPWVAKTHETAVLARHFSIGGRSWHQHSNNLQRGVQALCRG